MRINSISPYVCMGNVEYSLPKEHKIRDRANIVAGSLLGLSAMAAVAIGGAMISSKCSLKKLQPTLLDKKIVINSRVATRMQKPYSGSFEYLSEQGFVKSRTYEDGYLVKCVKYNDSFDKTKDYTEVSVVLGADKKALQTIIKKVSADGKIREVIK